jgi:hypothetical protein
VKELLKASSGQDTFRCDSQEPFIPREPQEKHGSALPSQPTQPEPHPRTTTDCHLEAAGSALVEIRVSYPQTEVWIQGKHFGNFSESPVRQFHSPALDPCGRFNYNVGLASWKLINGQWMWVTDYVTVPLRANRMSRVFVDQDGTIRVDAPQ